MKNRRIISQSEETHRFQTPLVAQFGKKHIQRAAGVTWVTIILENIAGIELLVQL